MYWGRTGRPIGKQARDHRTGRILGVEDQRQFITSFQFADPAVLFDTLLKAMRFAFVFVVACDA